MANSGGGCIVFGVTQKEDGTFIPEGVEKLKDPAELRKEVGCYLPSEIKYQLKDFVFESSEYEVLKGKKIQILIIEDVPTGIPFVYCKDGVTLKNGDVYVRKDTESIRANNYDIDKMINRKMNALKIPIKRELPLDIHLGHLKKLYDELTYTTKQGGITELLIKTMKSLTGDTLITHKKDCYPKEDYDTFVVKMIEKKKKRIEEELNV